MLIHCCCMHLCLSGCAEGCQLPGAACHGGSPWGWQHRAWQQSPFHSPSWGQQGSISTGHLLWMGQGHAWPQLWGLAWLGRTMAGQGCEETEPSPAMALLGQGLRALVTWWNGPGQRGGPGGLGTDTQGCLSPWGLLSALLNRSLQFIFNCRLLRYHFLFMI